MLPGDHWNNKCDCCLGGVGDAERVLLLWVVVVERMHMIIIMAVSNHDCVLGAYVCVCVRVCGMGNKCFDDMLTIGTMIHQLL